jgi:hypothetical protein
MSSEKQEYYAHTNGSCEKTHWQPLKEHFKNTARQANKFIYLKGAGHG